MIGEYDTYGKEIYSPSSNLFNRVFDGWFQLTVNSLKERVQELNIKVRQLTSFIEEKSLVAAFKEFLKPKPKSIVETLKENKAIVAARKEQHRKVMLEVKKRRSSVR